ncbi:MAG: acyltransferase [candidate division Zixibacteria bacterium]|jgi:acetyltransferase-like isoleucine patch superfamily enzyme|nr:acyltransferase [candidate division Zixibacteria bacterium]
MLIREIVRAIFNRQQRFRFRYHLVRNLPGEYGFILRRRVLAKWFGSLGKNLKVHEGFRFRNIELIRCGSHVNIGVDAFIQAGGGVEIGDYAILGPGVKVWTQNHASARTDIPIQQQGAEYKPVVIGRDVWIGANAFIMPGVTLGEGCVVAAGAVVGAKNYPPYKILAGNPARVIGTRENSESAPTAAPDPSRESD